MERWFANLTEKQIRRVTHCSARALEDAIRLYLKLNNENLKPFVWLKTAESDPRQQRSLLPTNL